MREYDLENPNRQLSTLVSIFYFPFRSSMIKLSVDFRNAQEMKLKEENTSSVSIIKNKNSRERDRDRDLLALVFLLWF